MMPAVIRVPSSDDVKMMSRLSGVALTFAIAASSLFCQTTTNKVGVVANFDSLGATAPFDIFGPGVLATDASGNLYLSVRDGVWKLDPSGIRTRVAGTEREWRYSGDGGPAVHAGLNPHGIAVNIAGDLYIADAGNHRIRKLAAATGIITTVAGNGVKGFGGDGGPAASAQLDGPTGVAVDSAGNLYIADGTGDGANRIRRVEAATGVITTVAGNGTQGDSGDGGPATLAQFSSLGGLATDGAGNLYIADNFNNRIRMVSAATGIITTVAGNGLAGFSGDGGLASGAELDNPLSMTVDIAGNLYIADSRNRRIRKVRAADGTIATVANGNVAYRDSRHTFPCSLALDASGDLYIADSGSSQIRRVPADVVNQVVSEGDAPALSSVRSHATSSGFKINVTYGASVPAAAQTAFNNLVSIYESVFTTNITVNINVNFGNTGLGESLTAQTEVSYSAWRAAMIANATANPGNTYAVGAAASLPANDPIGGGHVFVNTATARALGFTANTSVDSTLTFSNSVTFEYNGVANSNAVDFLDTAAHELDEGLGIGSALTGLADNAAIPSDGYVPEDYFRYSAAGVRDVTTSPAAVVYFSYDGGNTNVAQFNQAFSAQGVSGLDRNDWIYGDNGCPAATVHIQSAIACYGQAVAPGSGPEITVLSTLGYNSSIPQTITFGTLNNVMLGIAPFTISATASSGLAVIFASTTTAVCTVSGNTVTVIAVGTCSITASQPGNGTYSAAAPVTRSFTVSTQGVAPSAPTLVSPVSGAVSVSPTASLVWNASSGATSYDVYLGSSSTPPFVINTTGTNYTPATLNSNTMYFWRVVAKNAAGSTSSTTWSFTTHSRLVPGDPYGFGKLGMVWLSDTTRQAVWWYMNGAGGNTEASWAWISQSGVYGWRIGAIADFNGDGYSDLLWVNDSSRQAVVWYMGGTGGNVEQSWEWISQAGVPGWSLVGAADFNHDGIPDLLWQNDATRQVVIWYMSGAGTAGVHTWAWLTQNGVPGWGIKAVADFNHDGTPDVVWQNDATRQSVVWYLSQNGTNELSWEWISQGWLPGWSIAGAGDFNGDGNVDVLLVADSTRQAIFWYLDGPGTNGQHAWTWVSQFGVPGWWPSVAH